MPLTRCRPAHGTTNSLEVVTRAVSYTAAACCTLTCMHALMQSFLHSLLFFRSRESADLKSWLLCRRTQQSTTMWATTTTQQSMDARTARPTAAQQPSPERAPTSHGEVGSKQLGASAANNQTRGIYPAHPTTFTIECLDEYGKISQRHELLLELPDMSISAHYISWVLEGQLGACQH